MFKRFVKAEQAVLSLEACILLPMFIMLLLFFYGIIISVLGDQMISHALLQTSQSLSMDRYANDMVQYTEITNTKTLVQALYSKAFDSTEFYATNEKWYEGDSNAIANAIETRFLGYLGGHTEAPETYANDMLDYVGVVNGVDGFDFSKSSVNKDTGLLTITVTFKQDFLFNFYGYASFDREYTVQTKLW